MLGFFIFTRLKNRHANDDKIQYDIKMNMNDNLMIQHDRKMIQDDKKMIIGGVF